MHLLSAGSPCGGAIAPGPGPAGGASALWPAMTKRNAYGAQLGNNNPVWNIRDRGDLRGVVASGDGAQDLDFLVDRDPENPPHLNLPLRQTVAAPLASALDGAIQTLIASLDPDAELIGTPVPGVTEALIEEYLQTEVLVPVLEGMDEAVLVPVFRALGINLGGADIELFSLEAGENRLLR